MVDIRDKWTLLELQEAHGVLDALELAEERSRPATDSSSSSQPIPI